MTKTIEELRAPNGAMHAIIYPYLAMRCADKGYALGIHGSVGRDLDLIAVPWTAEAVPAEELIAHLTGSMGDSVFFSEGDKNNGKWGEKPHGRRCWSLHLRSWTGSFIDLSVMPRSGDAPEGTEVCTTHAYRNCDFCRPEGVPFVPPSPAKCATCGGSGVTSAPYELDAEDCPACGGAK